MKKMLKPYIILKKKHKIIKYNLGNGLKFQYKL